jgi:hypothetical protein
MSRLGLILRAGLVLAFGAAAPGAVAVSAQPRPPNVIVIVADDLGYGDTAVYGVRAVPRGDHDRPLPDPVRL